MSDIARFMDDKGRVKTWPGKKEMKLEVLKYISEKFEKGRFYTEKEVNAIIEDWHTFGDYFLLRRGMVDYDLLSRTNSGSRYWKEERDNLNDIIRLIEKLYDAGMVESIFRIAEGFGSQSYYILTNRGEYILKDIELNYMNHPENEAMILCELSKNGIPVSEIVPAKNGDYVLNLDGKVYHLQCYIEGKIYGRNSAPEWLLYEAGRMLGKIHNVMDQLPSLPTGMGQGFFDYMTPQKAKSNYLQTLELASQKNDTEFINAIHSKLRMLEAFEGFSFEVSKMTSRKTHGDYKLQQIISGRDKINAVIDFTSACVHPVCWEIIRSYTSGDRECIEGNINIDIFRKYISCYLEHGTLNSYDLKIMPYLYYYQNLVSDYFGQYYASDNRNKQLLREDALFSLKLCRWFEGNIEKLEDALVKGF
jgi:aminoglycoside phosphotransferase (APT) family kinase protein